MEVKPIVSVVMITYGHEKYIEESINGVFLQQTDFPVELIIANDCSPDNTDDAINRIMINAPETITVKYTRHENNLGIMPNFIWALEQAQGKYVALCEGDDYWTDNRKLQRQVDFLELDLSFSLSSENSKVIDERNELEYFFSNYESSREFSIEEILKGRKFHTASVLFRKNALRLPKNTSEFPFGDTLLFVNLALKGKIHYNPVNSSVYRRNVGGVSNDNNRLKWAKNVERFNLLINDLLEHKYTSITNKSIAMNYYSATKWAIKNFKLREVFIATFNYLKYYFK